MAYSPEPVCVWFYARHENLRRILSLVASYRPPRLYLISDGPREDRPQDAELCRLARLAAEESITWPCKVMRNYSDANLGPKMRIVSGIDWVFQQEESAIFLEDDTIPHPTFFPYCEALLNHYREDQRVMHVGGSNPLSGRVPCQDSYLFSRYFQIWGFATWRRTWNMYDVNMTQWPRFREEKALHAFYSQEDMCRWMTNMFDSTCAGHTITWDVQLFFACLFNNGLSIVPCKNLISNIGYEGFHASASTDVHNMGLPVEPIDWANLKHPRYICPSFEYDDQFIKDNFATSRPTPRSPARGLYDRLRDYAAHAHW